MKHKKEEPGNVIDQITEIIEAQSRLTDIQHQRIMLVEMQISWLQRELDEMESLLREVTQRYARWRSGEADA